MTGLRCAFFFFFYSIYRGKAISVAVVVNFGFNLLVTLVFPTMLDTIGSSWSFAIFGVLDAYSLYFIKTRVSSERRSRGHMHGRACVQTRGRCSAAINPQIPPPPRGRDLGQCPASPVLSESVEGGGVKGLSMRSVSGNSVSEQGGGLERIACVARLRFRRPSLLCMYVVSLACSPLAYFSPFLALYLSLFTFEMGWLYDRT